MNKVIHPSGFILFSDLKLKSEVTCNVTPEDFLNDKPVKVTLLGPSGDDFVNDSNIRTVMGKNPDGEILTVNVDEDILNN